MSKARERVPLARAVLGQLSTRPYSPLAGFSGARFGRTWADIDRNGCDTRSDILRRDLGRTARYAARSTCHITAGSYVSYLTGRRAGLTSRGALAPVVDRVVPLAQAWRSGAKAWSPAKRLVFANDPLNLVSIDAATVRARAGRDLAGWKPLSSAVACKYTARRVAVYRKYALTVSAGEKANAALILRNCRRSTIPLGGAIPPDNGPRATAPSGILPDSGTGVNPPLRRGTRAPVAPKPPSGPVVTDPRLPMPQGDGSVLVMTSAALHLALDDAQPGDVIVLADGTFDGSFKATPSGTADKPITLRGTRAAKLTKGSASSGTALTVEGNYWRLSGFTVHSAQKGVVMSSSIGTILDGLELHDIGMEAVHFRAASSDGAIYRSYIHNTGVVSAEYGEGVYIGSAQSNWDKYSGGVPDRSDRVIVEGNQIVSTAAEGVDIKEGTTGGVVRGNRFERSGYAGENFADSWIDVKGHGWTITGNVGTGTLTDAIQVHVIQAKDSNGVRVPIEGSGTGNVITGNRVDGGVPGFVVNIDNGASDNTIMCDNTRTDGSTAISNIPCS